MASYKWPVSLEQVNAVLCDIHLAIIHTQRGLSELVGRVVEFDHKTRELVQMLEIARGDLSAWRRRALDAEFELQKLKEGKP